MIDHRAVREQLELAAIEPAGLDRLAAGDTPEATAIAGHLAGCPACLAEFDRLQRTISIARAAVTQEAAELPPELRARTLAFVRELGVTRPQDVAALGSAEGRAAVTGVASASLAGGRERRPFRAAAWIASIAAAVVIAVLATSVLVGGSSGGGATAENDAMELAKIASWTVRVAAAPDAREIGLAAAAGGYARGSLTFSARDGSLVVVADGLAPAPSGKEYRCWLETPAGRTRIGRMYLARTIAYWVGDVTNLGSFPAGTRFGVSLEDLGATGVGGPAVLIGTL
ncbi:MAG: anti-sigma factor [Candidatus Limnocylindrales bacterium]